MRSDSRRRKTISLPHMAARGKYLIIISQSRSGRRISTFESCSNGY
ncbi:hypothetical protein LINGRAHAP2_LOCUS29003 [Linum grandiflorum]